MKRAAALLLFLSCQPPRAPEPASGEWVLAEEGGNLAWIWEPANTKLITVFVTSRIEGEFAVTRVRVVEPDPESRYRIHAVPARPGIVMMSPTIVDGAEATFVYSSVARGWAGLRVWAVKREQ